MVFILQCCKCNSSHLNSEPFLYDENTKRNIFIENYQLVFGMLYGASGVWSTLNYPPAPTLKLWGNVWLTSWEGERASVYVCVSTSNTHKDREEHQELVQPHTHRATCLRALRGLLCAIVHQTAQHHSTRCLTLKSKTQERLLHTHNIYYIAYYREFGVNCTFAKLNIFLLHVYKTA